MQHSCRICTISFQLAGEAFTARGKTPLKELREMYENVAKCNTRSCSSSDVNRREAVKAIRAASTETDTGAIVRRMIRATYCLSVSDAEYKATLKDFHALLDAKYAALIEEREYLSNLVRLRPIRLSDGLLHCAQCDAVTGARERCENCHSPQGLKKCCGCSVTCVADTDKFCVKCGVRQV